MKKAFFACLVIAALVAAGLPLFAAKVGDPAPAFTATDSNGKTVSLSDYKGKFVVLEWHNNGCPFVLKHYNSGNMQKLQKDATAKGVVWLVIVSSAPGKQGYVTAAEANAYMTEKNAVPTATLLDPEGIVGHAYDSKTTPHMFVIDPKGILIYNGAIDDKPTADLADVATAKNYLSQALSEALAGKPVSEPATKPYGCTVKYASGS
jgi:peroxiredoxin